MRAVDQIINKSVHEVGSMTNLELLKFRGVLDSDISTKMNQQALLVDMCNRSVLEMEIEAKEKGEFRYDAKKYINKVKNASGDMIVRNDKKYGNAEMQEGFGEVSDRLFKIFDIASRFNSLDKLDELLIQAEKLAAIPLDYGK